MFTAITIQAIHDSFQRNYPWDMDGTFTIINKEKIFSAEFWL